MIAAGHSATEAVAATKLRPVDQYCHNQERIAALRDQVIERSEEYQEETEEVVAAFTDDAADQHADIRAVDAGEEECCYDHVEHDEGIERTRLS